MDFLVNYFVIGVGVKIDNNISYSNKVFKDSLLFFWVDFSKVGGFVVVYMVVDSIILEMLDFYGFFVYKV